MATIPQVKPKKAKIIDEAAAERLRSYWKSTSTKKVGARKNATDGSPKLAPVSQTLLRVIPNLHNRGKPRVSWSQTILALQYRDECVLIVDREEVAHLRLHLAFAFPAGGLRGLREALLIVVHSVTLSE